MFDCDKINRIIRAYELGAIGRRDAIFQIWDVLLRDDESTPMSAATILLDQKNW